MAAPFYRLSKTQETICLKSEAGRSDLVLAAA